MIRGSGSPASRRPVEKPAQIPARPGPHVGVGGGRRRPLELAELREDFVGGRNGNIEFAAEAGRDRRLVFGVGVGVQQTHRHALGPRIVDVGRQPPDVALGDRAVDPLGGRPLVDPEAPPPGDERDRLLRVEVVQVRTGLSTDLEDVLEPFGRDERRLRTVALQEGVHRDGHRVCEPAHRSGVDARLVAGLFDPGHHPDALVVRRRHLRRDEVVADDERHVGERPADVDADPWLGHVMT